MILMRETTPRTIRRGDRGRAGENAVDAEAHAHLAALGLEVDVRGAALDGLGDDRVDELDDRARRRRTREVDDLAPAPSSSSSSTASWTASSRRLSRVISVADVLGRGDGRADLEPGHHRDVVDGEHVAGVDHRDEQRLARRRRRRARRRSAWPRRR